MDNNNPVNTTQPQQPIPTMPAPTQTVPMMDQKETGHGKKIVFFFLLGILLIAAVIGGIYYYLSLPKPTANSTDQTRSWGFPFRGGPSLSRP